MEFLDPISSAALGAAAVLMLSLLVVRRRQRGGPRRSTRDDNLDTVAAWPPEAARVLTLPERQAYDLLRRSLPNHLILAQVPLSRFVRVPMRHSYTDWLQRVGQLSADLVVCDNASRVLAVVDIRSASETERSRRRHERLARVLRAAGIRVHAWTEGALPGLSEVRALVGEFLPGGLTGDGTSSHSRPMPLIPVAEIEEILADGDQYNHGTAMEPMPSAFFDDFEQSAPVPLR